VEPALDLDAYFSRIGYAGDRSPTLATLQAIVTGHTEAIPFENLNPLLGWPVLLDTPSLEQKLVHDRRGGYCFEQNALLKEVLASLGYQATGLAARVLWGAPGNAVTNRSHMLLRIDLEGRSWIVDVGFGGLTLTGALRLEAGVEQSTPHEPFRLAPLADGFAMEAHVAGGWRPLYRFDLQPQFRADYEVTSWYLCHHPKSRFVNNLIAARAEPGRRYALLNNEFAIHNLNGETDRRILSSVAELREALKDAFRITLPDAPELNPVLERLILQPA
jgi:N-hydroxyarylamine O-acetyltransferase